jgi:predicted nucleotidyltransferase
MAHPDERFYLREIVRRTDLGHGQVQRELRRLTEAGIADRSEVGAHVYFQANPSCPVYPELRSLMLKTTGAVAQIRAALAPLESRIAIGFVYGSVARSDEHAASDVDLMVVGTASFAEVAEATRGVSQQLGRSVNPTVYGPDEFRAKADGHFLRAVVSGDKAFVIGNSNELAELLGK